MRGLRSNVTEKPMDERISWYKSQLDKDTLTRLIVRSDAAGWKQTDPTYCYDPPFPETAAPPRYAN
jgi:hypothetical protein